MTDRHPLAPSLPTLEISPEPAPDELAALSVAILAMADAARAVAPDADPPPAAWRVAALREGVGGIAGGVPSGWGRPRAGWRG